jgi:hypothetical protein
MLDDKLITWKHMDVKAIENAYDKIHPLISGDYPDSKTRNKLIKLLEAFLPDYNFKCDEENNPPNVVNSGNIVVNVSKNNEYINIIF